MTRIPPTRFCTSPDGTRIAYTVSGQGKAIVKTSGFLSHLEYEWNSPVWKPWLDQLGRNRRLVRFDSRGCGLSDANAADLSLEAGVADLHAVVCAAGIETFFLFGQSQGAALSIAYAARNPERVAGLILVGGYARGVWKSSPSEDQVKRVNAMLDLVELGWGQENPAFRQMFTSLFIPGGSAEQLAWFDELQRLSTTPAMARRILESALEIDVEEAARQVRCPTLVIHSKGDARIPFENGRTLAALIPGARLVSVDSRNHIVLSHEPAWASVVAEIEHFIDGTARSGAIGGFGSLTPRERELLHRIAQGGSNSEIAASLGLSEKTVRNHINRIFSKLAVANRSQAIVRAREAGFGSHDGH